MVDSQSVHIRIGLVPSNATWEVSENHRAALAAFREPVARSKANPSNRRRFRRYVFIANSGYRTRYPFVAAATNSPLG